MKDKVEGQPDFIGLKDLSPAPDKKQNGKPPKDNLPEKLGKAIRLPVPDFSDPERPLTCLEVDFPIAQINALAGLEASSGAAKKPIYQMSKWWARRQSSVFRSLLIAAATQAPKDPTEAAKLVWDHYYCNHQKAGSFRKLRVLEPFMGGGTTLVEGSRLGMQMTGIDLNPVAWFVVKNELACSDPAQVQALFDHIEAEVKPQVQPFYTTSCPRGHKGRWIDVRTGEAAPVDPLNMPLEERPNYRWEGPEVIYTFWAKHGPCQAKGCGHRTPIFRSPVIAEKTLSTDYLDLTCPNCGRQFHAELGEMRIAPGAERVVLEDEVAFTETSQPFAQLLKDYDKGNGTDTLERITRLCELVANEPGLRCPSCKAFAGRRVSEVLDDHARPAAKASERKKKAFKLKSKKVSMWLLIHPEWLKGASGFDGDTELGGWAGAAAEATARWFEYRLAGLKVVEVRGRVLPATVVLSNEFAINTDWSTVPRKAHFTCTSCGREGNTLDSVRPTEHTASVAVYALQCHCAQCESEGYTYGGRYFKAPDDYDIRQLISAEKEWSSRAEVDLTNYWPRSILPYAWKTSHWSIQEHGYTHWWKMFNARQLLVHAQILKAITEAPEDAWPLDVREQALGAFQQYLRSMSMYSFYHQRNDQLAAALSNPNFHPKSLVLETCVFNQIGSGKWGAYVEGVINALEWVKKPFEPLTDCGIATIQMEDPIIPGNEPFCGSSTDLSMLGGVQFDLVITDPPFGDNVNYADLSDFFYVWLRIPLRKWYVGLPEAAYFEPEFTPKSLEAIDNKAEHPDDREDCERDPFIESKYLARIRDLTGDATLVEKDPNPLYRLTPSGDFYCQTLTACWAEAGQLLKPGGIMAFTFHHNEDSAWIDVLKALFDSSYVLVQTYPIRSDETKGENASFGSQKIEYDIVHVCRKRLKDPEPVSWSRMRRWVREEAAQLKSLLEHTHGKELPEPDLRVILRGKSLEFFSKHYGQVYTGDGQVLGIRDALLGINQILDDLMESAAAAQGGLRPPDIAEPTSRLYLRLFRDRPEMPRDELHKTLRGTGISQGDLEARGWIRPMGKTIHATPIKERFVYFTAPGRNRRYTLKTDLDQTHFLIGAALPGSGVRIDSELESKSFILKKATCELLRWHAEADGDPVIRLAAQTAAHLIEVWRKSKDGAKSEQLTLFEMLEEED